MLCIDGVKGLPRVSWGQPEANLLKMPYGYQGSTRGQLKCVGPSNVANATGHYAAAGALVYITKISKSVCMYVCMSGYAFHHALRYRAESWHGGRGRAHKVCGHIFEGTPPGVKGHPEVNLP